VGWAVREVLAINGALAGFCNKASFTLLHLPQVFLVPARRFSYQTFVLEARLTGKSGWFDWLVACCLFSCGLRLVCCLVGLVGWFG
jgi:hypothetical protein